jgi:formylglycine-generating enzyme required for sulfatase activity
MTGCEKKENNDDNTMEIEMAILTGGSFYMGSPVDEFQRGTDETLHPVTLSPFRISTRVITNEQYAFFLNANSIAVSGLFPAGAHPDQTLVYESSGDEDWGLHFTDEGWVPVPGYEDYPAANVTWYGAAAFADYAGGRLPTEAEWEYACRAGTTSPFNTGNCLSNTQANYSWEEPYNNCVNTVMTGPLKTQAAGIYPPNAFGLYDMHGNVWEWCKDWYGEYGTAGQTDPEGPASGTQKVLRGGGYTNYARYCRSASRFKHLPDAHYAFVGFRIVTLP